MVEISLQEYLRTPVLGPVYLGMTRDQVRDVLGEPDAVGGTSRKHRVPSVLLYGKIELIFDQAGPYLETIYMDAFDVPSGGKRITLDPWLIRGGQPVEAVGTALSADGSCDNTVDVERRTESRETALHTASSI